MKTQEDIELVIRQLNALPNPNFPHRYTASRYFREALKWVLDQSEMPPLVQTAIDCADKPFVTSSTDSGE